MGWGTRGEGTAARRALRRAAPVVAAAAGAALVAGAASRRGRGRRLPGVEPGQPAEPGVDRVRPAKPAAERAEPAKLSAGPAQPASPGVEPARAAEPVVESARAAEPVVESARPATPLAEADKPLAEPATPAVEAAKPAKPAVEPPRPEAPLAHPATPAEPAAEPVEPGMPVQPVARPAEPVAPPPSAAPRHFGRPPGGRRAALAVVGAVVGAVVVAAAGIGVVQAGGSDDEPSSATASESTGTNVTPEPSTTATTPPPTPRQAVALAASRLDEAGSFTYRGTASATDVSVVRPMLWLAVDSTVEGEVSLAGGRLHEVAVAAGGRAVETVVDGASVWGRSADRRDRLDARGYERVPSLSDADAPAKGAALLPAWLAASTDHAEAGRDDLGRRRVAATVPADVFGVIEQGTVPVAATLVVTVDAVGAPVRVEITSAPGAPRLALAYDLAGLGAPVTITPPAPAAASPASPG